jgi:dihydrofolate reductase
MRKLILAMQLSLDGLVGGPNGEMNWVTVSEEMDNTLLPEMMARVDTCLLGRSLYQGFYSYWPTAPATNPNLSQGEIQFSRWIGEADKVVFSNTLESVEWSHSRLARGDLAAEVLRLKQQPGKDMITFGGARLAQALVRQGLVDQYDLAINPVILGQGLALFSAGTAQQQLELVSCKTYSGQAVALRYVTRAGGQ